MMGRLRAAHELRQRVDDVLCGDYQRQILRPHERRGEGTSQFRARQRSAQAQIQPLAERQVRVVQPVEIEHVGIAIGRPTVGIGAAGSTAPTYRPVRKHNFQTSPTPPASLLAQGLPLWLYRPRRGRSLWLANEEL